MAFFPAWIFVVYACGPPFLLLHVDTNNVGYLFDDGNEEMCDDFYFLDEQTSIVVVAHYFVDA